MQLILDKDWFAYRTWVGDGDVKNLLRISTSYHLYVIG